MTIPDFPADAFTEAGLNRQHIFALADLPSALEHQKPPKEPPKEGKLNLILAINQSAPLGNGRFKNKISMMTGIRQTLPQRGRPMKEKPEIVKGETQARLGF
ncbi:MAG: hypothetical protein LBE62_10210 [Azonexus sp.]|jgi:hypothetical protein|nr:hypothetical protein [Azonexus sp.]